ncbi:MAG: hypothetical protein WC301_01160 [Candidatus Omnitrophota bacterium]|jgi:photosystem II stability/assembly factor-like uncharacterized protein
MKKYIVFGAIAVFFCFCVGFECLAEELSWQNISRENMDLRALLVDADNPANIYIGASGRILKTADSGDIWRNALSVKGGDPRINFLSFDYGRKDHLYAATGNGLFYSLNRGDTWKRIFRGKDYLESECTCVAVLPGIIYLGTKGGLFTSQNRGRSWRKEPGELGSSPIAALASDSGGPAYIYAATTNSVFINKHRGGAWEKAIIGGLSRRDTIETEGGDEYSDEEELSSGIRHIAIDPRNPDCLYAATSEGIYKSCDRGRAWEAFASYGLLNKETSFILFSGRGSLYAISRGGIFEYGGGRWQELSIGLAAEKIRFLASDKHNNLYAACDRGLFKTIRTGYIPAEGTISLYYEGEPGIRDIQKAAIQYAEVGANKIKEWRRRAARKGILPRLTVGLDRSATDLWHWESGSSTKVEDDILRKGRDVIEWDITLSWDLSELIWSSEQTSIDARSRLMVQLREDILDEVTKLYFERIRVKVELDSLSIEDRKKRFDRELKLKELTASLDGLTGGYFSSRIID